MEKTRKVTVNSKPNKESWKKDLRFLVFIDDVSIGLMPIGEPWTVELDFNNHVIRLVVSGANGYILEDIKKITIHITPDKFDYSFIITINHSFWSGVNFIIEEDQEQVLINQNIEMIDYIVDKIFDKKLGNRDLSLVNKLPVESHKSDYYKRTIDSIKYTYYEEVVQYFIENVWDVRTAINHLSDLSEIPELKEDNDKLLKHADYFCFKSDGINDGSIRSVLPVENPVSALDDLEARDIPVLKESLLKDYNVIELAYKSKIPKDLSAAVNTIVRSNYDKEDLDALKKWLLFFGAFREGAGQKDAAIYKALLKANQMVFHPVHVVDGKHKLGKTVDMLIAEAMRCSRSNSFSGFDEELDEFLRYTCPFRCVDKSQYDILLKVFTYLGSFKEEKMVLQAMVDNMIERSPEQEARLAFLRNNDVPEKIIQDFETEYNNIESGHYIYEYRTLNWSSADVQSYFVGQSAQNRFNSDMSYVFAEWSKTINSSVKWDVESVKKEISRELEEDFGERHAVLSVKTAINSEWIEFVDTIFIVERDFSNNSEYGWLEFNIIGENITRKQTHLMVQALYWPGVDYNVKKLNDIYSKNTAAAKKTIALKEKQNPRWSAYIETVVNIIVGEIEKWLNSSSNADIY